jgi:hypothetical protein
MKQTENSNQISALRFHRKLSSTGARTDTYFNKGSSVIAKLLAFTAAMIVLPIGSYFVSVNTLFKGAFATGAGESTLAHLT